MLNCFKRKNERIHIKESHSCDKIITVNEKIPITNTANATG